MTHLGLYIQRSGEDEDSFEIIPFYESNLAKRIRNDHFSAADAEIGKIYDMGKQLITGFGEKKRTLHQYYSLGKVDFDTTMDIIEAQLATGGLIHPTHNVRYSFEEAIEQKLISSTLMKEIDEDRDEMFVEIDELGINFTELISDPNKIKFVPIKIGLTLLFITTIV